MTKININKYNDRRMSGDIPPDVGIIRSNDKGIVFEGNSGSYLNRTFVSGNQLNWTYRTTLRKTDIDTDGMIFSGSYDSNNLFYLQMRNNTFSNTFSIIWRQNSSTTRKLDTSFSLSDPNAFYDIIVQFDSSQTSAAQRLRVILNGVEVTTFSTDDRSTISQNSELVINSDSIHTIGTYSLSPSSYFSGIMCLSEFIDGKTIDKSELGFFDPYGTWVVTPYKRNYGTNGHRLSFTDTTIPQAIGYDSSGNGNHWTVNNISTDDVVKDTWTNILATSNVLDSDRDSITTSEGNLKLVKSTASNSPTALSTIGMTDGKYFASLKWESITDSAPSANYIGTGVITRNGLNAVTYFAANSVDAASNGNKRVVINGSTPVFDTYGDGYFVDGKEVDIALDLDAQEVTFYLDGVNQGAIALPPTDDPWFFYNTSDGGSNGYTAVWNFGQKPFSYTPPSGFKTLCTANASIPTITDGGEHFQVITWTGDGTNDRMISVPFDPDFVWIKNRDSSSDHATHDRVRGNDRALATNKSDSESNNTGYFTFVEGGFEVSYSGSAGATSRWNNNGDRYIAWCWKINGSSTTNNDGTIESTVLSDRHTGMSLCLTTGTGATGTFGHGLSSEPEFILSKNLDSNYDWATAFNISGQKIDPLYLNLTNSEGTNVRYGLITDTTIGVTNREQVNRTGDQYIHWAIHSVNGYSKIGSYTGNGNTDGPFVTLGFVAKYILIKRIDSAGSWVIRDTSRNPNNNISNMLFSESNSIEVTSGADISLTTNGFKVRNSASGTNASGGTYVFMAFAERPFAVKGRYPTMAF